MANEVVYIVLAEGSGRVKIGMTSDIERRFRTSTDCPFPITVLCTVPAAAISERAMHRAFGDFWLRREWFIANRLVLAFAARVAQGGERAASAITWATKRSRRLNPGEGPEEKPDAEEACSAEQEKEPAPTRNLPPPSAGWLARMAAMNHKYLDTREAAGILGVTQSQVRWYFGKGLLPGERRGERLLLFLRSDVERFEKPKKTGRPKKTVGAA